MSIITFVNSIEEETGKTMSLAAIATHMAIEYNNKILIISTTNKEEKLKSCYFEDTEVKKFRLGLFGNNNKSLIDSGNGIEGLIRVARSNKLTPEMITNYTRVVFKDRLEVLLGVEEKQNDDEKEIAEEYVEIINVANMYYDKVFVDLDNNIDEQIRQQIIDESDLVIVNTSQNYSSIKKLKNKKQKSELLKSPRLLVLVVKYDKYS